MIDCKYSYETTVKIKKGFYKGFTAKIKDVKNVKEEIFYKIVLENKKELEVLEEDLRPLFFGFF